MGQCLSIENEESRLRHPGWLAMTSRIEVLFTRWCRLTARTLLVANKIKLRISNDRMAQLHQRMLEQEASLRVALRNQQVSIPSDETQCCVCYEIVSATNCVQCTATKHSHCLSCVERLTKIKLSDLGLCTKIACMCINDCDGRIDIDGLVRCDSGRKLVHEWQHERTTKMILEKIASSLSSVNVLKLQYMRADGSFAALQCPSCGYGPIEHFHCDDLTEFHARHGYTNACPKCRGNFSSIKDYVRWCPESTPSSGCS